MKTLPLILFPLFAFAQSAQSVITPHVAAPVTVNYYLATTGNNSNTCTSASKCLTLAHILSLIPRTLDAVYVVNVADGTYAEPLDFSGFYGAASKYVGGGVPYIEVLGNTTTPANVVFSGTVACTQADTLQSFLSGVCLAGTANVKLSGLKVTNAQRNGIACYGGYVDIGKLQVVLTGGAGAHSVAFNGLNCHVFMGDDVTLSGYDTNTAPTGGLGLYLAHNSNFEHFSGVLTSTGNGGVGTDCLVLEYGGTSYIVTTSGASLALSACEVGILVNDNSSYSDFVGVSLGITNASVPSIVSNCIQLNGSGTLNTLNSTIVFTNFRVGVAANGGSAASRTGGTIMRTGLTANTSGTGNIQGF